MPRQPTGLITDGSTHTETTSTETKSLLAQLNISYAALTALGVFLLGLLLLIALAFFKKAPWSDVIGHLASVLIATGMIGVIYEVGLRRIFFKEISIELKSQLRPLSKLLRAELSSAELSSAGINVHRNLVDQNPARLFDRASSRIRILQTWMGNYIDIESSLKAAALRQCEVQILLLSPKSVQAEARSRDLGEPNDYVGRGIVNNIERLAGLCKRTPELLKHINLKVYDATPIMTLYWYDDTCYLGLYWREGNAIAKPQLEIDMRYSYYAEDVNSHFESLWNDDKSRLIDLSKPIENDLLVQ